MKVKIINPHRVGYGKILEVKETDDHYVVIGQDLPGRVFYKNEIEIYKDPFMIFVRIVQILTLIGLSFAVIFLFLSYIK